MRLQRLFILVAVLALPVAALAQPKAEDPKKAAEPEKSEDPPPLVIDLGNTKVQTLDVDAGTYKIRLVNAVPGREYFLRVGLSQALQLPVLELPGAPEKKEAVTAKQELEERVANRCQEITAATRALAGVAQESEVANRVDAVRLALASAGVCKKERDDARRMVGSTSPDFPNAVTLTSEAVRDIKVSNGLGSTWDVRLNSAGRGVWQNSYGFVFSPNHDEDYFTEMTGNEAFTIRRKTRDKNSITFLPAVFYTWLPSSQAFKSAQYGPTLGVGLTTDSGRIGGMLGYSLRFNQNIGITAGVSVYPHRRLDAKYHEGQVLKESLDSDQLNKDSVRGNIFVAFTLRLAASPFGK